MVLILFSDYIVAIEIEYFTHSILTICYSVYLSFADTPR